MRDIQQKVEGEGGDGSPLSSAGPLVGPSGSVQQEGRAVQLTGSEAELLLQLEEERLQVCGDGGQKEVEECVSVDIPMQTA